VIAFLRGRLASRGPDWVQLDVGGVGYQASTSSTTLGRLPAPGSEVVLLTSLQVKEDALVLYGFADREEQALFEMLVGVSSVGPRTALALLSALPPPRLRRALREEDEGALTAVAGVGRKTAQRLILELRERVGAPDGEGPALPAAGGGPASEAVAALMGLGYSAVEAGRAVAAVRGSAPGAAVDATGGGVDVAELVRLALRGLGQARA
jgi:Holliday junction DNA helicase RuvA